MTDKATKKITKDLNKLLDVYYRKIKKQEVEIKLLLIDFAREYNEVWKN